MDAACGPGIQGLSANIRLSLSLFFFSSSSYSSSCVSPPIHRLKTADLGGAEGAT